MLTNDSGERGDDKFGRSARGHSDEDTNKTLAFVSRLLTVDPAARLSVDEVLEHPWLAEAPENNLLSPAILNDRDALEEMQQAHSQFLTSMRLPDKHVSTLSEIHRVVACDIRPEYRWLVLCSGWFGIELRNSWFVPCSSVCLIHLFTQNLSNKGTKF